RDSQPKTAMHRTDFPPHLGRVNDFPRTILRRMEIELRKTTNSSDEAEETRRDEETVVHPRVRIHDLLQRPFVTRSGATTGLFLLAVFYTMYFVRSLLLPIVLSLLLSYLLRPIVRALGKIKIHPLIGSALLLLSLVGAIGYGGSLLATPAAGWIEKA